MAEPANEPPSWLQVALRTGFFTLRHRQWRRKLMFYISLAAMVQLGLGLLIMDWLSSHVLLFLLYWGFCACVVLLMLLLAFYDILAVRQEQQLELKRLRESVFGQEETETQPHADDSRDSGDA